jgi:urease accessory protein
LTVPRAININGFGRRQKKQFSEAARKSPVASAGKNISVSPPGQSVADWLLWQLADSAFPTGGFAHSLGLEAAWQHGEIRNRTELISFIEAGLQQLGYAALPLVTAAFDGPEKFGGFDQLCDAFTTNHVANRASRAQGRAMLSAVERIYQLKISSEGEEIKFAHFAPIFGLCLQRLKVSRVITARLFFFNQLRSVLAAAVRLNIVGPMEAQMLQHRLAAKAEEISARCQTLTLDDLAQTSPLLDTWQGAQDRLYSRLFQS